MSNQNSLLYFRLSHLSKLGFAPKQILDIGAYRGGWAKLAREIFPESKIFMVEANSDHIDILKKAVWADGFEIVLLGDKEKKKVNYFLSNTTISTGNSIFKEKSHFFDNGNVRKLPMSTLDLMVKKHGLKNIDFIKIDTQGSELNIVKGGSNTIDRAEFILLETQNLEYNMKAPYTDEVIKTMKNLGFWLYDIADIHYLSTGEMIQVDLIFVKKTSKFLKRGKLL